MTKVAILLHSLSGASLQLAKEIAVGAAAVVGTDIRLHRVPDTVPDEELSADPRFGSIFAAEVEPVPVGAIDDLIWADVIVLGGGTRFGGASGALRLFLEQASALWHGGRLTGKVGAAFATGSSPHGGLEHAALEILTTLMHFGMVIVTPGYAEPIVHEGGSPYGAVARAGGISRHKPTDTDLAVARLLGRRAAEVGSRLAEDEMAAQPVS